jgi:hypothetical protein
MAMPIGTPSAAQRPRKLKTLMNTNPKDCRVRAAKIKASGAIIQADITAHSWINSKVDIDCIKTNSRAGMSLCLADPKKPLDSLGIQGLFNS